MATVAEILLNYYRENKLTGFATLILTLLYYPIDIIAISNLTSQLLLLTGTGIRANYPKIILTLGLLLLAYLLLEIVGTLKDYLDTTNIPKFENYVRNQIIQPVFTKNLVNYDNVETAQLIQNLHKVPTLLGDVFERFNRYVLPFAMIIITVALYFFTLNKRLGVVALIVFSLYCLLFYWIGKGQITASKDRELAEHTFYNKIEDIINNIFTITLANTGNKELHNINQFSQDYNEVYRQEMTTSSKGKFITGIAVIILIGVLSYMIAYFGKKGQMSQTNAVLAFGTVVFMSRHFRTLTRRVVETLIEIGSLLGSDQFLQATGQTTVKNGNVRDFVQNGEITFQNVDFGYSPDSPKILNNFNLHKPGNSSITIRGPSGSGKSTIVKLLNGFYAPTSGRVSIDGVDLANADRYYLRSAVSFLPQTTRLFERPVIENMIYGTGATPMQAIQVINKLRVGKIFRGVDLTRSAGRFGDKLSGGQRQIVHLVRIYLANPKLVILDEPTTGIDQEHQKYVRRAIETLSKRTNVILITHEKDFSLGQVVNLDAPD